MNKAKETLWKLAWLFVAVLVPAGFAACGDNNDDDDDDDDGPIIYTKAPSLEGTWVGTFYDDDDEDDPYNEVFTFTKLGSYKGIEGLGEVWITRYDVPVQTYEEQIYGTYTQTHELLTIQTERRREKDMKTHEWKGWIVGGEIVNLNYELSKDKKQLKLTDLETGAYDIYYKE